MKCELCGKKIEQRDANVTTMVGGAILYTCDTCHNNNNVEE